MQRMIARASDLGVWIAIMFVFIAGAMGPASAENKGELLELEQIALNEEHIKSYLKIGPKLAKMFDRIDKANGEPDKKLSADLETLAREGGFKSFDDLETAVSNITFVMSGINEEDGTFREPVEVLKQELADAEADKAIQGDEKVELLASIKESIAHTPKLKHPGNVALVKKHFKALAQLFEE